MNEWMKESLEQKATIAEHVMMSLVLNFLFSS